MEGSSQSPRDLPLLSLFSGAGGLDLGFELAGFSPLLALDIDPSAVETYNWNRDRARSPARIADLSRTPPASIIEWWQEAHPTGGPTGIIGGPPCQAFSISNVHKLRDDPRATLPLAYARTLDKFNRQFDLDFFLFENVAGLGHRKHLASLMAFLGRFKRAGFDVRTFYLDAVQFGVPQYRSRMFIVGFNKKRYKTSRFPVPVGNGTRLTVRDTIGELTEPAFFTRGRRPTDFGLHPNHCCMNPRSIKFGNGALKPGEMWGRSFRMLEWDAPSWTVAYGHREVHVHPNGRRRLSVFEAMLLQGFPSHYELRGNLTDQIRLVSDAVPPPLAHALALSIRDFLNQGGDEQSSSGQSEHVGFDGLQTASPKSTRA